MELRSSKGLASLKLCLALVILGSLLLECNAINTSIRYLKTRDHTTETDPIFRVVVFADLLYGSNSTLNSLTQSFQYQLINYYFKNSSGIDLAIILGNAVDGTQWDGTDNNYFQDRWDMLMKPMIDNQIKVAFTFGDKDTQGNLKRTDDIIKYINSYTNSSFTFISPISVEGETFYSLPVHSSKCEGDIIANLQIMDSNAFDCDSEQQDEGHVGCISPTQISAFEQIIKNQKALLNNTPVNLMFSHQPIQQFSMAWNDETSIVFGIAKEQITCDIAGSQLMNTLLSKAYPITYFVAGKDTDNAFYAQTQNVTTLFTYAGGSGFTGTNKTERGAIVFDIKDNTKTTSGSNSCENPTSNIKFKYFTTSGKTSSQYINYEQRQKMMKMSGCNEINQKTTKVVKDNKKNEVEKEQQEFEKKEEEVVKEAFIINDQMLKVCL